MSYPRIEMIDSHTEVGLPQADQVAQERKQLIQKRATEISDKIKAQGLDTTVYQLAEEQITAEEEQERLKGMIDHDLLNPEVLSERGFYRAIDTPLREFSRIVKQRQIEGREIPKRVSFIMGVLDIDGFKVVNDRYGHPKGDQVLDVIGGILKTELRPEDWVARFHGDEYTFVLSNIEDMETAIKVTERVREIITDIVPLLTEIDCELSASIGLAKFPEGDVWNQLYNAESRKALVEEAYEIADSVHYKGAKNAGKNRIGILSDEGFIKTAVVKPSADEPHKLIVSYENPSIIVTSRAGRK